MPLEIKRSILDELGREGVVAIWLSLDASKITFHGNNHYPIDLTKPELHKLITELDDLLEQMIDPDEDAT